ncbi:DUF2213 domain-containing protein [Methylobacterium terricola]|uniref:DUF2213 domain-containing protein n=1 Tax=Methylobacterium terricola TaxID=2583531 RepID=A0A5C4LLS5_9HYPH|nr:DUF2213 domain-containing protein [Methylobacterium terricola]TNC14905.1 DUF2213 domain-containing protein [Methylobacterium terricola]
MLLIDAAPIAGTRITADGYLVADARVARVGVQQYLGVEVERPDLAIVSVYRPAEEVFKADSLASFAHRPVTIGHPRDAVNAKSWRLHSVGSTGGDIARDGDFVRVPLAVMDADAIQSVQSGKREVSMGYRCRLEWSDGIAPDGTPYQAIQRDININHAAIVPKGRAGSECRIGDGLPADIDFQPATPTPQPQKDASSMKTHLVDGHPVEMSDAAIIAVSALQKRAADLTADNLKLVADGNLAATAHAEAIRAKDGEIAEARNAVEARDGEIAVLKKQLADAEMTPAKLDAALAVRNAVIGAARSVLGDSFKADDKTEAQIRRETVSARLGDAAANMGDAAIEGAFAALTKDVKPADPLRNAIANGLTTVGDAEAEAHAAHARRVETLRNSWKGQAA